MDQNKESFDVGEYPWPTFTLGRCIVCGELRSHDRAMIQTFTQVSKPYKSRPQSVVEFSYTDTPSPGWVHLDHLITNG